MPVSRKKTKTILIVEDEPALSKILCMKLEELGVVCVTASDGVEALDHISKNQYDLILLDLLMPRLDGFEVLKLAREKKIATPIIVLSILSQNENKERAKEYGAQEYLAKASTSLAQIVAVVQKYIA